MLATGLGFAIVSQLVVVPFCILAYQLRRRNGYLVFAIGLAAAILPIYVQTVLATLLVEHGWGTPSDAVFGRFIGSSTYAFWCVCCRSTA